MENTKEIKKRIDKFTQQALAGKIVDYFGEPFDKDVVRLTAKERIDVYIKLAPFAMPKLQATSVDINSTENKECEKANYLVELAKKYDKNNNH